MIKADTKEEHDGKQGSTAHEERLALLYQGIVTAIVRIQSGKQGLVDAAAFQKRMEGLLDEIEREAVKVGYRSQDIKDSHYPIIAFLDETVRRSNDPARAQWTSLQAKRYGEAVAGEGVFERLKTIRTRQDSRELADLLEIYALCLLLGYQGRYAVGERWELDRLIEDLGEQIERIRGREALLSPEGAIPSKPEAPAAPSASAGNWKTFAMVSAMVPVFGWIVLWIILKIHTQGAVGDLVP